MEVRQFTPDDWETLRDVRLAALLDSPDAFMTTHAEAAAYSEAEWRRRPVTAAMFGAFRDGKACGMVGTFPPEEPDGRRVLVAMWVAPSARGSGAADALISAALDHAAGVGARTVELEVAPGNERAERVYARHGFQVTDQPSHLPGGLVMRRAI